MSLITLRLTDEQQAELENKALAKNQTVSDFIKITLFPSYKPSISSLTIDEILKRASTLPKGKHFSIPSLFSNAEWDKLDNTISIGRSFRKSEKSGNNVVSQSVKFVEKRSGKSAIYEKK